MNSYNLDLASLRDKPTNTYCCSKFQRATVSRISGHNRECDENTCVLPSSTAKEDPSIHLQLAEGKAIRKGTSAEMDLLKMLFGG